MESSVYQNYKNCRIFEVRGDSMNNESIEAICSGDLVVGRSVEKHLWSNIEKGTDLVITLNGSILLGRIKNNVPDESVFIFECLNPKRIDFEVCADDVSNLHEIVEVRRKRAPHEEF